MGWKVVTFSARVYIPDDVDGVDADGWAVDNLECDREELNGIDIVGVTVHDVESVMY